MPRKDKLVALKEYVKLETGRINTDKLSYENELYEKAVRMKTLASRIKRCKLCPGLNLTKLTESAAGWGDLTSPVFFVGQSLHEPGVSSGIPFIGGSGNAMDIALRLSGLLRKDVFISNTVHCHPPKNRASSFQEKRNCFRFLVSELDIVKPRLIVAMGNDAKDAIAKIRAMEMFEHKVKYYNIKHPAVFMHGSPEDRPDWIVKLSMEIDKCLSK
jgi:uracil-DNA glycosylase family 4